MPVPKSSLSSALVDRHQCVYVSPELPNIPIKKKSKFEYEIYTFKNIG